MTSGRPPDALRCPVLAALRSLGAATATGTAPARVPALLEAAQHKVAPLVDQVEGLGDDGQRVAFAVARLADALVEGRRHHPTAPADELPAVDEQPTGDAPAPAAGAGLTLATRQAVQVGVATSLAIIGGELISPSRWYWAVIAAFVVFAGTSSRGDVLTRGRDRVIGTIGGVIAGMALAFVVDGAVVPTLVLLLVCLFLAIYTVRISPGLLAFWITAVLALLYGLLGQFSVETLVLRVEETAIGAALGMLAGFLILPTGTREAFGAALDEVVDASYAVLDAAVERILGRPVAVAPVELARDLDAALGVLRQRAYPLDNPLPRRRGRSSYARAVRVFTAVDHYVRLLARISDVARAPDWAETLLPAVEQIRTNIDGLRALSDARRRARGGLRRARGGRGRSARRPPPRARAAQAAPGGHAAAAADGPGGVRLRGRPRRRAGTRHPRRAARLDAPLDRQEPPVDGLDERGVIGLGLVGVGAGEAHHRRVELGRAADVARDHRRAARAGVPLGQQVPDDARVVDERRGVDAGQLDAALHVAELPHVVLATLEAVHPSSGSLTVCSACWYSTTRCPWWACHAASPCT